jgi:ferredoxin
MCEFCVKHGDGKKWYLAMENYSRELLQQHDRMGYMSYFVNTFEERVPRKLGQMEKLSRTPFHGLSKPFLIRSQKRDHFGQIVPLDDIEQILVQVDGIIRLSCPCRRVTTKHKNARYCYALTADPQLAAVIDDSYNLEVITSTEAIESIRTLEEKGLFHSIWTFKTPYIGAICNCDHDCIPYRFSYSRGYYQMMFRSEYIGQVDLDTCNGCRSCMQQCHFGAILYSSTNTKVEIDVRRCFGCGVCRAACPNDAITLYGRSADPVAAKIW